MLALAVQYFMHPLLLSIKRNSVAKQNSTDAYTTTPTCNITYMHVYSHVHTHTHTHTHTNTLTPPCSCRMDSFLCLMRARRGMTGLWRCSFRLGLQQTCRTRWKIVHVTCGVPCHVQCSMHNIQGL